MGAETVSAAASAVAVIVSIGAALYAAGVGRKLQKQDHAHADRLQRQQQEHELQISNLETRVQQSIADQTTEIVEIERSRRDAELARERAAEVAALVADVRITIEKSLVGSGASIVIVNKGPAAAKEVRVFVRARVEPPPGRADGPLPRYRDEKGFLAVGNELKPRSSCYLPIELYDASGAVLEWTWEDDRPRRQYARANLWAQPGGP